MRRLVVGAGSHDPSALIADVRTGVLVEGFRHGRVELRAGRFRIEVDVGRPITRGRLGRLRRGFWLEGDVRATLAAIEAVGSDPCACRAPIMCGKGDVVATELVAPTIRLGPVEVRS
jgi:TldD protein